MTGVSWRPGCPVALRDLRVVTARHVGFDGRVHTGRLIVHRDVAVDVASVLRRLYAVRFPIRPHGPDRCIRGERLPIDRGRQHLGVQLSTRGGHDPLVGARVRPCHRPQPHREPVRERRAHVPSRQQSRTSTVRLAAGAWRAPATPWSGRSRRWAGDGAASGRGTGTTSTSPPAAARARSRSTTVQAGGRVRTGDIQLGRLALYQLSYARVRLA